MCTFCPGPGRRGTQQAPCTRSPHPGMVLGMVSQPQGMVSQLLAQPMAYPLQAMAFPLQAMAARGMAPLPQARGMVPLPQARGTVKPLPLPVGE